jgi:hypothetical protein
LCQLKDLMQLGFGTILFPEQLGGGGRNRIDCALVTEDFALLLVTT